MDTDLVRSKRNLRRTEFLKSQPAWWDHHLSPKNSRWLETNLEEMDRSAKRMLKLIEEDADSLAKKAEMYFQKRPELISFVEEFHRMYRVLAERYDNLTGELRKCSASDFQSQSSNVSDFSAELTSLWTSNEHRVGRLLSGRRAAGFDFFLGSGGNSSDVYHKEGDDSSYVTDSELESDDSSVNNYPGSVSNGCDLQALSRRVVELEIELREAKEKLRMHHEGDNESLFGRVKSEKKLDDLPAKLAAFEEELSDANEKIQSSEFEIKRLTNQHSSITGIDQCEGEPVEEGTQGLEEGATSQDPDVNIQALTEGLRVTRERLQNAEKEFAELKQELEKSKSTDQKLKGLQDQLESAMKEAATWKNKSSADRREVVKLHDRISMLKSSLAGRDHEIRDLKTAVADAEEKIFPEKAQIKAEISNLLEERKGKEEEMKELESRVRWLEDEIRRVSNEKREAEERMEGEMEEMKAEMAEKESCIEKLSERVSGLEAEREELREEIGELRREASGREKRLEEMERREEELEEQLERQRRKIEEVAEEKREVIRQLCFSLEHLRDECLGLRRAFAGHHPKTLPILAS